MQTIQELVKINQIAINDTEINSVSARELHRFLESKRKFTDWVKPYISVDNDYGFVQGTDFIQAHAGVNINNVAMIDYWITIDMAKEVSMLSKTIKGKEARRYFIECEKRTVTLTSMVQEALNKVRFAEIEHAKEAETWSSTGRKLSESKKGLNEAIKLIENFSQLELFSKE